MDSNKLEILSEMIKCSICYDDYRSPKSLPCGHTFCLQCLEKSGPSYSVTKSLRCALCRHEYSLPVDGYKMLPDNVLVEPLRVIVRDLRISAKSTKQCVCEICGLDAEPILQCMQCNKHFCEPCNHESTTKVSAICEDKKEAGSLQSILEKNALNDTCAHKITLPLRILNKKC